jgi:hypothetical protein
MIRIYNLTKDSKHGVMVTKESIISMAETLLEEIHLMDNEDEDHTVSPSQTAELCSATFFMRTTSELHHSLDFRPLYDLLSL